MHFRVQAERMPTVSKEVFEIPCHETQDGRRWGCQTRSNRLQSDFRHTEHVELSAQRTTRLLAGKGFR